MKFKLKEKMKSKKFNFMLLSVLCLMLVITGVLIIGTYTKMTDTKSGTDTARVATYSYTIQQTEGNGDQTLSAATDTPIIDLFSTSAKDTGIDSSGGDKLIAPGVEGHFEFTFTNNSEVPVMSVFDDLGYTDKGNYAVPIIFYFNGHYYSQLYNQQICTGKYGSNYTYYFHNGEIDSDNSDNSDNSGNSGNSGKGITLSGDMDDFKAALNNYMKISVDSNPSDTIGTVDQCAAMFLDKGTSTNNKGSIQISWFWPYEAKYNDEDPQTGSSVNKDKAYIGKGVYTFDTYNNNFLVDETGSATKITMTPVIRTMQLDAYSNPTLTESGGKAWNGGAGIKYGVNTPTQ